MGNDPFEGPTLFGIVEVDETLVGGKKRNIGSGSREGKTSVAGAIQRGGQVRIERVPNIRKETFHSFIKRNIKDEAEAIYTDDLKSYLGIGDADTRHETVITPRRSGLSVTFTPTLSKGSGACSSAPLSKPSTR